VVDDLDVVPVRVEHERAVSRHARVDRGARSGRLDFRAGPADGTSVKMIDRTYGHLAQAEEATRARLEARAGRLRVEETFSPLFSFESLSM
jgi:hypothetical protein